MYIILLIFTSLIFSSCTSDTLAPIEYNYNKSNTGKRQNYFQATVSKIDDEEIAESPMEIDNSKATESALSLDEEMLEDNYKVIYHEVAENEDLDDIAKNFNQTSNSIRKLNNMNSDEDVEELQIIKIKVPDSFSNKKPLSQNTARSKYIKPVEGTIITRFHAIVNEKKSSGIVIAAQKGAPIKSIGSGEVVYTDNNSKFGNLVIIKLDNTNTYVAYAHMQEQLFAKNSKVAEGEIIGHVGTSGNATRPQLYLAIRVGKLEVDPMDYVDYH